MRFARRLAVCVLAVVAISVLGALLWDQSERATLGADNTTTSSRAPQP